MHRLLNRSHQGSFNVIIYYISSMYVGKKNGCDEDTLYLFKKDKLLFLSSRSKISQKFPIYKSNNV